jgi:hypothetical protein
MCVRLTLAAVFPVAVSQVTQSQIFLSGILLTLTSSAISGPKGALGYPYVFIDNFVTAQQI